MHNTSHSTPIHPTTRPTALLPRQQSTEKYPRQQMTGELHRNSPFYHNSTTTEHWEHYRINFHIHPTCLASMLEGHNKLHHIKSPAAPQNYGVTPHQIIRSSAPPHQIIRSSEHQHHHIRSITSNTTEFLHPPHLPRFLASTAGGGPAP
jgi:hypothetical protein